MSTKLQSQVEEKKQKLKLRDDYFKDAKIEYGPGNPDPNLANKLLH